MDKPRGPMGDIPLFQTLYGLFLNLVKVVVRISLINGIVKPPGRLFRSGTFYAPPGGQLEFFPCKVFFFILNLFPEALRRASFL